LAHYAGAGIRPQWQWQTAAAIAAELRYDRAQHRRREPLMITSRDRILTTHVGSLPRNDRLSELLMMQEEGKSYDPEILAAEMDKAVRHVVEKQMQAGIDIGNDGEQRRIGFQTYVPQRMSGFAGVSKRRRGREFEEFPELLSYLVRRRRRPPSNIAISSRSTTRRRASTGSPTRCTLSPSGS
jgi:Cobalamin-independent synthase, Catalytic domain